METQNSPNNLISVETEFSKAQEKVNNFIKENKIDEELGKFKNEANDLVDDFYNKFKDFKLKKSENKGFLICENCHGYYKLQKDESPDEFNECECGGELKFSKTINL
ncbi:MAG: hypothetical protein Q8S06_11630 [Methanobacteriaceae archaeon]|nr:hypothetical protein [Methanobacteriaceae archaeon]